MKAGSEAIRAPVWVAAIVAISLVAFAFGRYSPASTKSAAGPAPAQSKASAPPVDKYADFKRADRYAHLKRQPGLMKIARLGLEMNKSSELPGFGGLSPAPTETPAPNSVVEIERARNLKSFGALAEITKKLIEAQGDDELYDALSLEEERILDQIKADRIADASDLQRVTTSKGPVIAQFFAITQKARAPSVDE